MEELLEKKNKRDKGQFWRFSMKKTLLLIAAALLLTACGNKDNNASTDGSCTDGYKDGTYHGESQIDEWGGKVTTDITVKDGKIVEASLKNLLADGSEKDENYGKAKEGATNPGLYKIAQAAVKNSQEYPKLLIEKGKIEDVEAISGATTTFKSFTEAVNDALKDAK